MPSADAWAGTTFPLSGWTDDVDPSVDMARIIGDKTSSITVVRNGVTQAAQTVRIETSGGGGPIIDLAGRQHQVGAIVFGYKGVTGVTDTDLQPGDRFAVDGRRYEVVAVLVSLPDGLQAICVALT